VFSDHQLSKLKTDTTLTSLIFRTTRVEPRIEQFNVKANDGKNKLLFYNGAGGYGDQILAWPVTKILADLGYDVHVIADPGNHVIWWYLPWIKSVSMLPIQFEIFSLFDHFALFEFVSNFDEHTDQSHPVDLMLNRIGINPNAVPFEQKSVLPYCTAFEKKRADEFHKGKKICLYQLSASSPVRSLPPDSSVFLLGSLAKAFPDVTWLALYDDLVSESYSKGVQKLGLKNVEPCKFQTLRDLIAFCYRASAVVSPDSVMVHLAGSAGIPCVGLWGPLNPEVRTKYYKNHIPIFKKSWCPQAPCNFNRPTFPSFCPESSGPREVCEVIGAIQPDDVIEKLKAIL